MLMILWKNIFINQIISNLTMEVVTSSFLVVFSFLLLSYIAADIQCLLNEIMIKKGGGRRWIIPTAVYKRKLWASTQGAKYTNVISLASTTSTLSFPLLTMIWWHSTHSENPLVLFAYSTLSSVQFSRSVVSDSLQPQQKQLPMGPLSHLVPPAAWLHWSLDIPTTWLPHGVQCLSLSLQAVNIIHFVFLNLFLFSSCNRTRLTIS